MKTFCSCRPVAEFRTKMYTTKTTRTVRTFYSDGRGPPKVETKTFTYGGDGGSSVNGGINIQGGGGRFRIRMGGGGDDGGDQPSYSAPAFSQRPQVIGRPSRKDKKDPFSGVINQSYDEIKKRCQEEGCLFEDPEFDAEDSSIFFSRAPPRPFEWKRPHVSYVFCANCTITSCLFFQHECMHSGKAHSQLDFFLNLLIISKNKSLVTIFMIVTTVDKDVLLVIYPTQMRPNPKFIIRLLKG